MVYKRFKKSRKYLLSTIAGILLAFVSNAQQGPPNPVETDTLAPFVTSTSVLDITANSATLGGDVTGNGGATVTERGIVFSTSNTLPTVGDTKIIIGNGNGVFSQLITGLTGGTTYYVRAYAINIIGTSYGGSVSFTTSASVPVLSTSEVSSITNTSAVVGGNISFSGGAVITERGVAYSNTNTLPTVTDSRLVMGSGTGLFSQSLSGLTQGTLYYLRAYAINSVGTAYGNVINFTVAGPTVSTDPINIVTPNSAVMGGIVNNAGSSPVTEKGIVYASGNTIPTTADNKIVMGTGTGSFSQTISGLSPASTYSVRAYAINGTATNYGVLQTFTTNTTLVSIKRTGNQLTNSNVITFAVKFAQPLSGLTSDNFSLTATGVNNAYITAVSGSGTDWIVTAYSGTGNGTVTLNLVNSTGLVPGIGTTLPFAGETYNIDRVPPMVNLVSIASNNTDTTLAKPGDLIRLLIIANESLAPPVITINGHNAAVSNPALNTFLAGYTMTAADTEGVIGFALSYSDLAGNPGDTARLTTNNSSVRFDKTAPLVSSIVRNGSSPTISGTVQYSILFSEPVTGVDVSDFSLNATNSLAGYSVTSLSGSGSVYTAIINTGNGSGFLRLDLNSSGTGIADIAGNPMSGGFTTGESYSIQRKPVVKITNPATICVPQKTDLTSANITSGSDTLLVYTYFTNAAATSKLDNPGAVTTSGIYYIVGTNSLGTASDPIAVTVTIDTPVPALRLPTVDVNQNDPVQLQARNIATAYLWSPSTGLSSASIANPSVTTGQEIQYTVQMTLPSGCKTMDTLLVRVFDQHLYVPNVFSPNSDGINDILRINTVRIQSFHYFRIFNRYGKMVFETTFPSLGWDGKLNGQLQPVDTYVWMAEAVDNKGSQVNAQGAVTLLR